MLKLHHSGRVILLGIAAPLFLALSACAGLRPAATENISTYMLDAQTEERPAAGSSPLTLIVSPPRAGVGFDSARMAYVRQPHELEYFAASQWADSPARMVAPLLVRTLENGAGFRAVAPASSTARGDLRLDTELVRLQQEFTARPSRVRLTMRAQLVEVATRRVVATREFEVLEDAPADTPYGGVVAANRALARILGQIAEFCSAAAGGK